MLLKSVSQVDKGDNTFCVLKLRPSKEEAEIDAKMWNTTRDEILSSVSEMRVVSVFIKATEYKGNISFIADSIRPAEGEGGIDAFIECSPIPGPYMYDYVTKVLFKNPSPAASVAGELYRKHKEELCLWPAAMKVHHAYKGGLVQHMGTVTSDCKRFCCSAAGKHVDTINSQNAAGCVRYLVNYVKQYAGNSDIGRIAVKLLQQAESDVKDASLAKKMVFKVILAAKLMGNYPFLNVPLLISATALRGISRLTGDPMLNAVGPQMSDMLMVRSYAGNDDLGKEEIKLLLHCMLVERTAGHKAAIPEAYLISELDRLEVMMEEAGEAIAMGSFDEASLLSAAAIHDIGKLHELASDEYGTAEFELDGNIFGHTVMSIQMAMETADSMGIPSSSLTRMFHCIASHHGKTEWGALVEPAGIEAKILAAMDFIDSRMEMYRYAAEKVQKGERNTETRIYLGNVVYRAQK